MDDDFNRNRQRYMQNKFIPFWLAFWVGFFIVSFIHLLVIVPFSLLFLYFSFSISLSLFLFLSFCWLMCSSSLIVEDCPS